MDGLIKVFLWLAACIIVVRAVLVLWPMIS
jgi:hypothetical protein